MEAVHVVAANAPPPAPKRWQHSASQVARTIRCLRPRAWRGDDVGKRAEPAQSFVMMGEISSGRQVLKEKQLRLGQKFHGTHDTHRFWF